MRIKPLGQGTEQFLLECIEELHHVSQVITKAHF